MTFNTVKDANRQKLIQLTDWSNDTEADRKYLETSRDQVMRNPKRITMFVQGEDFRIALFANPLISVKRNGPGPGHRVVSKSGKFKSLRHLVEVLFAKRPDIPLEQFMREVKKEYPKSATAGIKCYSHFCWYRHHLRLHGRFRCIPRPKWFKVAVKG